MAWIKLHSKLTEWEWASRPEVLALWIHILLRANFKEKRWEGKVIPRGSFITGRKALAEATGLTEQQVRSGLTRLASTNEIDIKSTNRYTIITVCKYDDYQVLENEDNQQTTNEQPTNNQQITTTIEDKNIIKETNSKELSKKVSEPLDLSFIHPALLPDFEEYLKMRRTIKKPIKTQRAINDRYTELQQLSNHSINTAKKIIQQSISKEWLSFVELKDDSPKGCPTTNSLGSKLDHNMQVMMDIIHGKV